MTELTIYFKNMPVQHNATTTQTQGVCKKIRRKGFDEAQLKNAIKSAVQGAYLNKIIRLTRSRTGMLVPWVGSGHRGVGVANFRCNDIEITIVPTSAGGNNTTREVPCSPTGVVGSNKFNYTGSPNTTVNPPQCPPASLAGVQGTFTWQAPSAEAFFQLSGTTIVIQYRVKAKYVFHSHYLGSGSYSGSTYDRHFGPYAAQPAWELGFYDKTVNGTSAKTKTVPTMCPY
jgi:hypothetical protein